MSGPKRENPPAVRAAEGSCNAVGAIAASVYSQAGRTGNMELPSASIDWVSVPRGHVEQVIGLLIDCLDSADGDADCEPEDSL
jgi:hypothetical protein